MSSAVPLQPLHSYMSVSVTDDTESLKKYSIDDEHELETNYSSTTKLVSTQFQLRRRVSSLRGWGSRFDILQSRLPTGWQFGAWTAIVTASSVLLLNIIITIWASRRAGGNVDGPIMEGSCDTVSRANLGIHLVINILSTLLLGASNYVMQSLSAPTRKDINEAHAKGTWLDIGIYSIRNLRQASRRKQVLWACLALSSIPLHLFYNSSFFSVVSAYHYNVYIASGPEITNPPSNGLYNWECGSSGCPGYTSQAEFRSRWQYLSPSDCMKSYATDFLTDRNNIALVVNYTQNGTVTSMDEFEVGAGDINAWIRGPYGWICDDVPYDGHPCAEDWTTIDSSNWTVDSMTVKYCISENMEPTCQLAFNLPLLIIVIFFNVGKIICMVLIATQLTDYPLVTIGDAIASFIREADIYTKGMCLVSQAHFKDKKTFHVPPPLPYEPKRIRWMKMTSNGQWAATVLLFVSAITIVLSLLAYAISILSDDFEMTGFSALKQLGLGTPHAENIIQDWAIPSSGYGALVASTLVSNSPQLLLSIIYLFFNSLCTKLFLAREWSSYAHSRKPLRVSYPQGLQRSTYFLQIPFRYGLPLLAYSVLLHWLISQSIFLVSVNYIGESGANINTCGFSPIGMISTTIVGGLLILGAVFIGYFVHLDCNMPLVGSCSAAIAAACHAPEGDSELDPVQWGVVPDKIQGMDHDVQHISFSSGSVSEPIPGDYYT